jgi:hypothetical protein
MHASLSRVGLRPHRMPSDLPRGTLSDPSQHVCLAVRRRLGELAGTRTPGRAAGGPRATDRARATPTRRLSTVPARGADSDRDGPGPGRAGRLARWAQAQAYTRGGPGPGSESMVHRVCAACELACVCQSRWAGGPVCARGSAKLRASAPVRVLACLRASAQVRVRACSRVRRHAESLTLPLHLEPWYPLISYVKL